MQGSHRSQAAGEKLVVESCTASRCRRRVEPIMTNASGYTLGTRLSRPVSSARPRVEAALKAEGFGVLTEIDVAATMKAKLGVDGAPYLILGACNPILAHRALEAEPSVGVLLPCNVVLRQEGADTIVEAMDPLAVVGIAESIEVKNVAAEARERLGRVIASLESD
jgi:uncharacterized protein (DUF302 family)